ncbi:hypothetical protein M407DRAFT_245734, partial [Tulasnella calospora MUT 4182]
FVFPRLNLILVPDSECSYRCLTLPMGVAGERTELAGKASLRRAKTSVERAASSKPRERSRLQVAFHDAIISVHLRS